MLIVDNRTLVENSTMLERANPYPSKVVWVNIPGNACNLSCEYCYAGSVKGGSAGRFPHPVDYVLKCFDPKRFGGPIFFGGAAGGETLLTKDIVPLTEGMLSYGHVVSYTTNMTLTPVLRQFCEFPSDLRAGLELDGSLHYLELKGLNKLDAYFDNLNMLKDAGISIAIFLVISDLYIPHLREIRDLCLERVGLLPIAGMMREYDKQGGKLVKDYSQVEELVAETCDTRQWEQQKRIYGHKRTEFCHAGEYSINVDLRNGVYRKCWNYGESGNIFENPDEPLNFEPMGQCPFYDCVCASYLCWGLVPEADVPTHPHVHFTRESVSRRVWSFMDSRINQRRQVDIARAKAGAFEIPAPMLPTAGVVSSVRQENEPDYLAGLRRRYEELYCGVVYDAMRFDIEYEKPFVVDRTIKPIWKLANRQVIFGHAFTCKGRLVYLKDEIDDTVRIKMFSRFTQGCVQVIDTGGDDTVAHFGDISGKIARKFGCIGAVIGGYTRDVGRLEEDRFPVFCRGVQPVDAYGEWQIVEYQTEVFLSGVNGKISVSPNDFVFGDSDGVIVIPGHLVEEVCRLAEDRLAKENEVREQLADCSDIMELYENIGRW